jgi:hypothetical protein
VQLHQPCDRNDEEQDEEVEQIAPFVYEQRGLRRTEGLEDRRGLEVHD